jgi:agmatine/peptidylarginine deiminase
MDHRDYRMPAEWEPHDGTWLQWPQDKVYPGYELKLEGTWLAMVDALYSNYLVANGVVLVPVFGHAHDPRAKDIIAEQFPGRDVIGIDAVGLIEHGGAIGCVTQPQPMGRKRSAGKVTTG